MQLSAEVIMYPVKDEYMPAIQNFVDRVNLHAGLNVVCDEVSTRLFGDYDLVMEVIRVEMRRSFEQFGHAIFVCKFIDGDLSLAD